MLYCHMYNWSVLKDPLLVLTHILWFLQLEEYMTDQTAAVNKADVKDSLDIQSIHGMANR